MPRCVYLMLFGVVAARTTAAETLRLAGSLPSGAHLPPNEGRVEILMPDGSWATICDDGWDIPAATVACQILGYVGASKAVHHGYYGEGSGEIALGEIRCQGRESSLLECEGLQKPNCRHEEDAGVPGWHSSLWSLFDEYEALMRAHPYFSSFVLIALGTALAVAAATACVSVEVVVFKDQRRRIRIGCCWRMEATQPPGASGGGGGAPATPMATPVGRGTRASAGSSFKPPTRPSGFAKVLNSLSFRRDDVAQDML